MTSFLKHTLNSRVVPRTAFALLLVLAAGSGVLLSYSTMTTANPEVCLRCAIGRHEHTMSVASFEWARWKDVRPTALYEFAGRRVPRHDHEFVRAISQYSQMRRSYNRHWTLRTEQAHIWQAVEAEPLQKIALLWPELADDVRTDMLLRSIDRPDVAFARSIMLWMMCNDPSKNTINWLRRAWRDNPKSPYAVYPRLTEEQQQILWGIRR